MTKEEHELVFKLFDEVLSRSMFCSSEVHWGMSQKINELKERLDPDNKEESDYLPTWSCC